MEDQNIEYKENWQDKYLEWVCGFANAQGGSIYIGCKDDGTPVGIENPKRLMEDLPNKIINHLGILPEVNLCNRDGHDIIELVTYPSNVPISYQGKYHYRCGATKQVLNGIALQQFLFRKYGLTWDSIPHETASLDDIDRQAIDYFLSCSIEAGRLPVLPQSPSTEQVLQSLRLITENGKLKNAALVVFGKDPLRFFPSIMYRIGRFGNGETDLMFQDSVEGNILQMTDKVVELLRSKYLISPIHYEGLQRHEPLEIPETVLREMIFNSIIHKEYMGPHIQMKVFNDRISVWNDGLLPERLRNEKLFQPHASYLRNPNIANVFYRAGFIECWGRGIELITSGLAQAGLRSPVIEDFMEGVRVTIYRPDNIFGNKLEKTERSPEKTERSPEKTPEKTERSPEKTERSPEKTERSPEKSQKTKEKIIILLRENNHLTIGEIADILNIKLRVMKRHFTDLQHQGKIRHVGPNKGGYWEVLDSFNE